MSKKPRRGSRASRSPKPTKEGTQALQKREARERAAAKEPAWKKRSAAAQKGMAKRLGQKRKAAPEFQAPTKAEIERADREDAEITRKFKKRIEAADRDRPKPQRGARTKARAKDEAKAAKRAKARKKSKEADVAPEFQARARGQVTLTGEELPPPPAVTLEEREIIQRIATTSHFRASIDAEALDEITSAATFLQRRAIVRDRMKALPKVESIPDGAKDAECDEIVRAFERRFMLRDVPWDLEAAKRSEPPAPVVREVPVQEIAKPVAREPKTFEPCPACAGTKQAPSRCPDPKCGEPLYAHECGLGKKVTCEACKATGQVPCRRCNGHGEVEWLPEGQTTATAVACGACRPDDHAKDVAALPPTAAAAPEGETDA